MRKYIISDIHGNGNLYYSVMSYIENISKIDDVVLYINGDLIDRGPNSSEILLDLILGLELPEKAYSKEKEKNKK